MHCLRVFERTAVSLHKLRYLTMLQKESFRAVITQGRQILRCHPAACQTVSKRNKVLSIENINPHVKKMEYAVRGPIVIRAGEIEQEMAKVFIVFQ